MNMYECVCVCVCVCISTVKPAGLTAMSEKSWQRLSRQQRAHGQREG